MKKSNLWHVLWIVGVYAVLVSILYLVVLYKVKWEDKDLRTYLYFYNCQGELCTSQIKTEDYYSSFLCEKDICPYIADRYDNILVLSDKKREYLFDYINNKTINSSYDYYKISSDGNIIVRDKNNKYGVINSNNEVVIDFNYSYINDYANGFVSYKDNNKYGIDNKGSNIHIKPEYEGIVLINDQIYSYIEDNKYYIASYTTGLPINKDNGYDYIYYTDGYILTIKDKQIDIVDTNLESKLIMKINSHYSYGVEKERASLNIHKRDNYIYFSVYENNGYTKYMFDIKSNKLYS